MDQLTRLEIPFVLIETSKIHCCELLKDKVLAIQGDAKRHDILQAAGIELARGVCIVIDKTTATTSTLPLLPRPESSPAPAKPATPKPCATRALTRSSSPSTKAAS